jgi:hypothetical protein
METVGVLAGISALLMVGLIVRSLWVGVVPGRWPAPPIARSEHPFMFWFGLAGYSVHVIVGTIFAVTLLT